MSSEQEANKLPVGSHLMAFTSFCKVTPPRGGASAGGFWLWRGRKRVRAAPYRVSLEGLDGSVLAQLTNMDAHVCAAGGERVIALPVHVQSRSCGGGGGDGGDSLKMAAPTHIYLRCVSTEKSHLSGTGTAASPPPCGRPK